ncbi:MAG: hypothetical protein JW959_06130 [Pirellulales bacterium]|nr:hypothetical protein [Pirellulales bacterium]
MSVRQFDCRPNETIMARRAKVTSIDALPLLTAALQKFRGESAVAMDDLEIELRRITEWIHHDRKQYWAKQRERAYENLSQARLQLQQARMSRRLGDQEPACIDEKRAVAKAKRRLEIAQQKIDEVRRWTVKIDRALDEFQRSRTQFASWLEGDLQRAVAALNKMSESLVSYISLEAPEADRPATAAPGEPQYETETKGPEP